MPSPLANDTFLRACLSQPTDYTPVWLMRQAGRYLPEYRATRERAPEASWGWRQNPDYRDAKSRCSRSSDIELDAAILFSDILTIPDAMGLGLCSLPQGEGPQLRARPLRSSEADVEKLNVPDMDGRAALRDGRRAARSAASSTAACR